jgi:hypothetical protein
MFRGKYMTKRSPSSSSSSNPIIITYEEVYAPSESARTADLVDDMVRVWWESNGMPTMLMDRSTARYVRRSLRLSEVATTFCKSSGTGSEACIKNKAAKTSSSSGTADDDGGIMPAVLLLPSSD